MAKPVLDIDIIVASLDDIPAVRKAMVGAGYHDAGEMKMPGQVGPGRFAFRQPGYAVFLCLLAVRLRRRWGEGWTNLSLCQC